MRKFLSLLLAVLFSASNAVAQITMGGRLAPTTINGFSACRPYIANHGKLPNTLPIPEPYTNFPGLFNSTIDPGLQSDMRTVANGGLVTSDFAYDVLIFPDKLGGAGGGKIAHEIDYYNSVTGELIIHFKTAALSVAADYPVYVCFGKSSIVTSQQDITNVWDPQYKAVWHFGIGPNVSVDSTVYHNDLVTGSAISAPGGQLGYALAPGAGEYRQVNNVAGTSELGDTTITLEAWFYLTSSAGGLLYTKMNAEDGGHTFSISPTLGVCAYLTVTGWGSALACEGVPPRAGDKKYAAFLFNPYTHQLELYVNGELAKAYDSYYGGFNTDRFVKSRIGQSFPGWIDEMRVSNPFGQPAYSPPRSRDWIKASYLQQLNAGIIWATGPRL